jgi:hypothetical protein
MQGDFLRTGGTYYADSSNLVFGGIKAQTLAPGATQLFSLTINKAGGSVGLSGHLQLKNNFLNSGLGTFNQGTSSLTVVGDFQLSSLNTFNQNTSTLTVGGNFILGVNSTFNKATGSQYLILNGTGTLTDSHPAGSKADLGLVQIAGGSGTTVTLGSEVKMSTLTINSNNIFSLNGSTFAFVANTAVQNNGTVRLQGG